MNPTTDINSSQLAEQFSALELARALAAKMAIAPNDWHRLKNNRQAQAGQQLASALVFLLRDEPEEALGRIKQAAGWLDKTIKPLPCPTHGSSG